MSKGGDGKRPVGRPTKLTEEVQRKICDALSLGNFRSVAAWHAGVSPKTFRDWMAQGKEDPDGPMGEFRRAVIESEKSAEIALVKLIKEAGEKDAKHAEWLLSHRHADRWAEKKSVKLSGEVKTGPLSEVSSDKLAELLDAARKLDK